MAQSLGLARPVAVAEGGTGEVTKPAVLTSFGISDIVSLPYATVSLSIPSQAISANSGYDFNFSSEGFDAADKWCFMPGWSDGLDVGLALAQILVSADDVITVRILNFTASPISITPVTISLVCLSVG